MPRPLVAFPCGSVSITSVRFSATARQAPRLMAVVVLPTPPFWFAMAMMRDTPSLYAVGGEGGSGESTGMVALRPEIIGECSTWNIPCRGSKHGFHRLLLPPAPLPHLHHQVLQVRRAHAGDAARLGERGGADPLQLLARLVAERHELGVGKVSGEREVRLPVQRLGPVALA